MNGDAINKGKRSQKAPLSAKVRSQPKSTQSTRVSIQSCHTYQGQNNACQGALGDRAPYQPFLRALPSHVNLDC